MISIFSNQFLFFWTIFLFFQVEQPVAVANSCLLRMYPPFSKLFFTFPDDKLLLQFLSFFAYQWYHRMSPVYWYWFHSKMPAVLLKNVPGSQASRAFPCQYFRRQLLLFCIFPFITRLLLWLLPSFAELRLVFNKLTMLDSEKWYFADATGGLKKKVF